MLFWPPMISFSRHIHASVRTTVVIASLLVIMVNRIGSTIHTTAAAAVAGPSPKEEEES